MSAEELRSLTGSASELRSAAATPYQEFTGQANRQIAGGIGMFGDVLNWATNYVYGKVDPLQKEGFGDLRPSVGSAEVRQSFRDVGITTAEDAPTTPSGRAGEYTGLGAMFMLGLGAYGKKVAGEAGPLIDKALPKRIISGINEAAVNSPKMFMAAEAASSVGAGVGGYHAEQAFPNSPMATFVGDVLGAATPQLAVPMMLRVATKAGPWVIGQLTGKGGMRGQERAYGRLERAIGIDKMDGVSKDISSVDVLPNTLTPAQKSGNEGLLALEKSIIESSDDLMIKHDTQIAQANNIIKEHLLGVGGDVAQTQVTIKETQDHFKSMLATRIKIAAHKTNERVAKLSPTTDAETANRIAYEEVNKALRAAKDQEAQLYKLIDNEAITPTVNSSSKVKSTIDDLSLAQKSDMPDAAKFLDPSSKQYLGHTTNIKELRGVQSKLREEARIARADKKFNKARIADDLADSITEDIALTSGGKDVQRAVAVAVNFSREVSQRFNHGSVAKILGRDKFGSETIPSGLTLENTIGGGGARARENYQEILFALRQDGQFQYGSKDITNAAEDYVKNKFLRSTIDNISGEFSANKAQTFLKNNAELLNEMPALQQAIRESVISGKAESVLKKRVDNLTSNIGKTSVSKATMFIKKDPMKALDSIYTSPLPGKEIINLMNMAAKDGSGEATLGLKSAFREWVLNKSLSSSKTVDGDQVLSGLKMQELFDSPKFQQIATRLLSEGEISRLKTIINTAIKLERGLHAKPSKEGVIGDMPGRTLDLIVRIGGAQLGRVVAGKTGGGTVQTPSIVMNIFKKALEAGVRDPAKRLLVDAMEDEALLKALMLPTSNIKNQAIIEHRLNAWLAGTIHNLYLED